MNTKRSCSLESDKAEAGEDVSALPRKIIALLGQQDPQQLLQVPGVSAEGSSRNRLIESIMSSGGSQNRSLTRSFQEVEQAMNKEKGPVTKRKSSGVNYFNSSMKFEKVDTEED